METIRFDIHGLVGVEAGCATPELAEFLRRQWRPFVAGAEAATACRVRVAPVDPGEPTRTVPPGIDPLTEFLVTDGGDGVAAAFFYRGTEDMTLSLGDPIEIRYRPRPGAVMKIYGLLLLSLHLALGRRRALLCHGAVLARGERGLVLAGPAASKKTLVFLRLLDQGWDYVADDKFVLSEGKARLFERTILVRADHVRHFPELAGRVPGGARFARTAPRRRGAVARLAFLPRYLHPMIGRFLPDPVLPLPLEGAFPGVTVREAVVPRRVILLGIGTERRAEAVDARTGAENFVTIQRLQFSRQRDLLLSLELYRHRAEPDVAAIVAENMGAADWIRARALPGDGPDAVLETIGRWLEA